jgi:hypothetical protein
VGEKNRGGGESCSMFKTEERLMMAGQFGCSGGRFRDENESIGCPIKSKKKREENPEDVELIIQDGRHGFERGD